MLIPTHRTPAFLVVLCVLFFVSLFSLTVSAQETPEAPTAPQTTEPAGFGQYPVEGVPGGGGAIGDFVVGPGKVDVTVERGQSRTVEMIVTNRTGEPKRFNITVEDAEGSQDANKPIVLLGDDRGPYSIQDYIKIPYTSFNLGHNQRARIPVTIDIPENAEPGGRYGSVLIDTVAIDAVPGDTGGTAPQSAIIARIGTLFFITIPGGVEKGGGLKDFVTVPEQKFYQSGPVNFGILYENTGSIHLAPYGELRIKNMFNDEIGFLEIDPWFVLPQSLRLREISWDRELLFGRYTATVLINRSYDDVIDEQSFTFWVLPWKPILGIFVVLFLIFFAIRTFFKRFEFKRKA